MAEGFIMFSRKVGLSGTGEHVEGRISLQVTPHYGLMMGTRRICMAVKTLNPPTLTSTICNTGQLVLPISVRGPLLSPVCKRKSSSQPDPSTFQTLF